MSFQDLEAGTLPRRANVSLASAASQNAAFDQLHSSLSLQVFKINANVQGILKLVDQLGTSKDTGNIRKALHDITETTRQMAKRGTEDLKKLTTTPTNSSQQKTILDKISHDFQLSVVAFQRAQQLSAERQRTVVEGIKIAVEEEETRGDEAPLSSGQRQAQLLQSTLTPAELSFQESIIQEREEDIREIEAGIVELSEIFRDLGTIVQQQGGMIDNIETNITAVADNTREAANELDIAHEYQRRAGRRAACLMIVIAIVICIVLLANGSA
ncbi:hypothetical protein Clacol_008436 [Clathrus columnatus]|uniref:t-SNARE coiled-coil homology domain-containing protein n=1 Tax=Clathrus columnatus TaxID=1419009 RepID=A0AAV5AIH4_9AGAM|nr:hypothetical protein Clacol_008436 [Clathrus columnatus]